MVSDLHDHKISSAPNFNSVQNLRPLGSVEAYNFYNGVVREGVREGGREGGREGHFVCCLELLRN